MVLWKNILFAVLGLVIPALYSWITRQAPGIPLPSNVFTELVIWAVGWLIGGWNAAKARLTYLLQKTGSCSIGGFRVHR